MFSVSYKLPSIWVCQAVQKQYLNTNRWMDCLQCIKITAYNWYFNNEIVLSASKLEMFWSTQHNPTHSKEWTHYHSSGFLGCFYPRQIRRSPVLTKKRNSTASTPPYTQLTPPPGRYKKSRLLWTVFLGHKHLNILYLYGKFE